MLSLQEISDRMEIQDLCYRYAQIIDAKDFDSLRSDVFTADAFIDYSVFGGSVGDLEHTITFLKDAMTPEVFPAHQHMNANLQIVVNDDRASGRIMCLNPQEMRMPDGGTQVFFCALWYIDEYVRTDAGWRIERRVEEKSLVHNAPDFMADL
jgi:hypothetical protein